MDTDSRLKFDVFFKDVIAGKNEDHLIPSIVGKIEAPIPHEGLVYDYLFEVMLFYVLNHNWPAGIQHKSSTF